jgi:segregation and condensation protein B
VSLATVLERPVTEVKAAIARLVADFDGVDGTVQRGFELREIGGGWRIYVRESYDELVRDVVLSQNS